LKIPENSLFLILKFKKYQNTFAPQKSLLAKQKQLRLSATYKNTGKRSCFSKILL